ncbi:GNAT family N-acetyltransferase [Streptomyces sp. BI20]|uniref:GNAT family N-acetyltransferase n=1 Tax=Streptomyces sp. BI20 TaxID=3403460 RepID=UPI003C719AFC
MTTPPGTPGAHDAGRYAVRPARPQDAAGLAAVDSSFTTDTVLEVSVTPSGFGLREVTVDPPLRKVFPEDTPDPAADAAPTPDPAPDRRTYVAVAPDGRIAGFGVFAYAAWNRRLVVEDIALDPAHRGRGLGRALIARAEGFARERGAVHLWLEVSNVNAPAVRAYRRWGFALCGLDLTLYDGTPATGEHALYLSRPTPAEPTNEHDSWQETAHLLRSPANARRLPEAVARDRAERCATEDVDVQDVLGAIDAGRARR